LASLQIVDERCIHARLGISKNYGMQSIEIASCKVTKVGAHIHKCNCVIVSSDRRTLEHFF